MNPVQPDMIDKYLRGELSGTELASFEEQMQANPSFRDQVQYEQFVKEGLSQYRKVQLKSRLDAIEIAPEWYGVGSLGSNTILKIAGGSLAAVLIGTIGYFALNLAEEKTEESVQITYIEENNMPLDIEAPAIEVSEPPADLAESQRTVIHAEQRSDGEINAAEEHVIVAPEETPEDFVPQVSLPGLHNVDSEDAMAVTDVTVPGISRADEIKRENTPLDVKTVHRRSETVKYKYFDGKLYLYGDFGKDPYEILEINRTNGRKIYVYFGSDYYEVNVTDRVEELPKITDQKLKKELEILRTSKLDD